MIETTVHSGKQSIHYETQQHGKRVLHPVGILLWQRRPWSRAGVTFETTFVTGVTYLYARAKKHVVSPPTST